jgi:HK97 family phage portal protein
MSIFSRLTELLWGAGRGSAMTVAVDTEAGEMVTDHSALSLPVVSASLDVRAGAVASLPVQVFRRLSGGARELAHDHPLSSVLALRPNERQTSWEFRQQMQRWLDWYRNAYAEIVPGARGAVDALVPLSPTTTYPEIIAGQIWYRTWDKARGQRLLSSDEVWHLRAPPFDDDGKAGLPVLRTHADTIGAALAVHNYGRRFFRNDGQSGGILEHPSHFREKADRDAFMAEWRKARAGRNQHRDAMLEFGIKYGRASLDNQKSQFLETRKENALELARIWRIPAHKLNMLDRATYSNIEHQALEFLTDTLLPIIELWEQKINSELIIDQRYFVEFNVAGLLRGDTRSMYEAFKMGREGGWLSINDIRRMLNMNPIEHGNDHLQPLNMAPAGTRQDQPATPPRRATAADLGL